MPRTGEHADRGGTLTQRRETTGTHEEPHRGFSIAERDLAKRGERGHGFADAFAAHRGLWHRPLRLLAALAKPGPCLDCCACSARLRGDHGHVRGFPSRVSGPSSAVEPAGDVTDVDMATLTSLDATSQGIRDLDGLQYATNLANLDLSGNRIGDVTPLAASPNLTHWISPTI